MYYKIRYLVYPFILFLQTLEALNMFPHIVAQLSDQKQILKKVKITFKIRNIPIQNNIGILGTLSRMTSL